MVDEFRGDPKDRDRAMLAVALVVVLLLVVGGGALLFVWQRTAARQIELRAVEAERAARDAAVAASQTAAEPATSGKPQVFTGRVVRLMGAAGISLEGDDGTSHPLIEDAGSRMLFLDSRLRDRPVRLTAIAGTRGLQVVHVQTITHDGICDVDYFCDICRISLTEPGPCYCCGEETKLRERPPE